MLADASTVEVFGIMPLIVDDDNEYRCPHCFAWLVRKPRNGEKCRGCGEIVRYGRFPTTRNNRPATWAQRGYAKHLGLKFPKQISVKHLSQLIDGAVTHDPPASENLKQVICAVGIKLGTRYLSESALIDYVTIRLSDLRHNKQLAIWFLYWLSLHLQRLGFIPLLSPEETVEQAKSVAPSVYRRRGFLGIVPNLQANELRTFISTNGFSIEESDAYKIGYTALANDG